MTGRRALRAAAVAVVIATAFPSCASRAAPPRTLGTAGRAAPAGTAARLGIVAPDQGSGALPPDRAAFLESFDPPSRNRRPAATTTTTSTTSTTVPPSGMAQQAARRAHNPKVGSSSLPPATTGQPGEPPTGLEQGSSGPVPAGSPRDVGHTLAIGHGWSEGQWSCLDRLWGPLESGWNPTAANPRSGAYGIPQALPGSKMATAGSDWRTNPATQVRWGISYIVGRYRNDPCVALGVRLQKGSY